MSDDKNKVTTTDNGNNVIKAGFWYTISSISVKAIGIITTPLYTRLLSTADYGKVATLTSWYSILSVFVVMALYYSIGRAKIDFPGKLEEYVGSLQLFSGLTTLGLVIVCIIFLDPVSNILGMSNIYTIILLVYLLSEPAIILNQNKYKYQYKYKANIAISIYSTLATALFSFLFIFVFPDRGIGRATGIVLPAALLSLGMWAYELKNGYLNLNRKYITYALKISLPLILHTVSLSILAQSDRLVINQICGETKTAIYSLSYQYAVLVDLVYNAVGQAWLPWFHDNYGDGTNNLIRDNLKPLLILGLIVSFGAIGIAPEAMAILGTEEYQEGVWVIAPVVLGTFAKFVFQNYEHVELHLKKTGYISAATIGAAVLNIVLNYIFVPMYGFIAAAYTTFFCYLMLMIAHQFVVRIILKQNVYNDKFMYFIILLACVVAVAMMMLYDYVILRYIIIVVVVGVYALRNRNYILQFIGRNKK